MVLVKEMGIGPGMGIGSGVRVEIGVVSGME